MRKWFGVFFFGVVVSGFLAMPGVAGVKMGIAIILLMMIHYGVRTFSPPSESLIRRP